MDQFVQQLVNGLTLGSVYALIALGYSMVYGVLKLLNFAHGELYMIGAFLGYFVMLGLGGPADPAVPIALMVFLMFIAGAVGAGAMGVAIERFAYRPLRDAPRIAPLITALGVSFFLQASALLLFGARIRTYETNEYLPSSTGISAGPLDISLVRILVIVATAALMVGLIVLVGRSKSGKAMRAVSYDREAAQMMGIDVDRTVAFTFLVGSALAGIAGVMVGLVFTRVFHLMGFLAGLKGFTAAVVGGIGSIPGAMLGGLLIGMSESMVAGYISSTFQNVIVFALLIGFMLLRPTGLLGKADIRKV
jgi:branched-chain amino acid transport system permease protein